MATPIEIRAGILSEFWLNFRDAEEYKDLIQYADLAFPLAYSVESGIVKMNDRIKPFIDEAFDLLLASIGIEEDNGFETLDDILGLDLD